MTQPRQQAWTNLPLLPSLKLSTPVPYPLFAGSPRRLFAARGQEEAPYGISQSQGSSASKNPADDMPKLLNIRGDQLRRQKDMGKVTPTTTGGGVNQSLSLGRLSNKEIYQRQSLNNVQLDEDRKQVLTHSKKSLPHLNSHSPNTIVTPFQSNQPKQSQTMAYQDENQQESLKMIPEDYHILSPSQPAFSVSKADQTTQTDEPPQQKIIQKDLDSFKVQSRFKSYKEINDSYARQLEQREKQIEKWKNMHSNALEQLRGKTEELSAYEKALASSETQIQSLRQQLDDALEDILKKEKKYQIARSEMKDLRKDTTEYQTLMDENVFLKQELNIITKQKTKLEETTTQLQTGLANVKNWSQVSGLAYSNQLQDYLIIRIHEYQNIINKEKLQRDQLTSSENRNKQLEDENSMLLRTNRSLIEEISIKAAIIDELAPHNNQSKAYKKIQESAFEEKEREITNLLLSFDKRSFRKTSLEGDNSKQSQGDQSSTDSNTNHHPNSNKKDSTKQALRPLK